MTSTAVALGPGTRATTIVRFALAAMAVAVALVTDLRVVTTFPIAIDATIPLTAAQRWLDGGVVYVADGFTNPDVLPPFLYPPFVLPFVAPLTLLPEQLVRLVWWGLAVAVALLVCRRLAIPWRYVAIVLVWEPMLGSIWGANVQLLLFAAFVAAFWRAPAAHDLHPEPRDLEVRGCRDAAHRLVRSDRRQREGHPDPCLAVDREPLAPRGPPRRGAVGRRRGGDAAAGRDRRCGGTGSPSWAAPPTPPGTRWARRSCATSRRRSWRC